MKSQVRLTVFGAVFAAVTAAATPALAAMVFLTSNANYTGPVLNLAAFDGRPPISSQGPVALPGGISVSANNAFSIGRFETDLDRNGLTDTLHIDTGAGGRVITFRFGGGGVGQFGVFMNFERTPKIKISGAWPTIEAFDLDGTSVAYRSLKGADDIGPSLQDNVFAFRGFDGNGVRIGSMVFSNARMVFRGETVADVVPEPGSWAMMIAGFGLVGASLRRRTAVQRS